MVTTSTLVAGLGAFERVAYNMGNLWFVCPIDCNIKHHIFQSIYFPYMEHGMFKRSSAEMNCTDLVTSTCEAVW